MYKSLVIFLLVLIGSSIRAAEPDTTFRKKSIDTSNLFFWPSVGEPLLSNNGRFFIYTIHNMPFKSSTLVLVDLSVNKIDSFFGASSVNAKFSNDSKYFIFLREDKLVTWDLNTSKSREISGVLSYQLDETGGQRIFSFLKGNKLNILDLASNRYSQLDSVSAYWLTALESELLIEYMQNGVYWLYKFNYKTSETVQLVSSEKKIKVISCPEKKHFAVLASIDSYDSLYWIDLPNSYARNVGQLPLKRKIIDIDRIAIGCDRLFVRASTPKDTPVVVNRSAAVDIWNHKDVKLQSVQLVERPQTFEYIVNVKNNVWVLLVDKSEALSDNFRYGRYNDSNVLVRQQFGSSEEPWNIASLPSIFLTSTYTGSRVELSNELTMKSADSYVMSPDGKYVIFYDPVHSDYFSYCIETCQYRNLTKGLGGRWIKGEVDPQLVKYPIGICGFVDSAKALLIYDRNDIYYVYYDSDGQSYCLTRHFGRKNNMVLRTVSDFSKVTIRETSLLVKVLDLKSKKNGYCRVGLLKPSQFTPLMMDNYIFDGFNEASEFSIERPIKALDTNLYVVRKMSASESPNYFLTSDFKEFLQLTNCYPERGFNWLRSQLITWKSKSSNSVRQGILYLPENFDPKLKYPVILFCYEKLSNGLNGYIKPQPSSADLNIPYFVSNGYIVFTVDIYYNLGHPGKSAANSLIDAVDRISKYPWIDKNHLGLQGHSFGAYEVLYTATTVNRFQAVAAFASVSNFTSSYGSLKANGESRQNIYENSQSKIGGTLWDRQKDYLENSPVLYANKMHTPLLLNNNQKDPQVPFSQGIEMFTALRRLGKSVWMLQYDNEGHFLLNTKNSVDLTIRMHQFFDHYLKEAPPPIWMTKGVPAFKKGIIDGYELDPSGNCSKSCKICRMWNHTLGMTGYTGRN